VHRYHAGRTAGGGAVVACLLLAAGQTGCRQAQPGPKADNAVARPEPPARAVQPREEPPCPALDPTALLAPDPEQWLTAESLREGAEGGWVTGSFDPRRNKLDIRTNDVTAFALDTGRLPIDWRQLVVLSIDGSNSELRRRERSIYRFQREESGGWTVREE